MPPPGHLFDAEHRAGALPGWSHVRVRFDARGLVIEFESAPATVWPYTGIGIGAASGMPSSDSPRVTLTSTSEPGATLTVDSPEFAASIRQAAPQLGPRQRGPDWMPLVLASLATIATVGALLWGVFALFPYKAVARRIPEETRARIGELAMTEMTKSHKRCETPAGSAALNKLVDRLAKASGTEIKFKVRVVDWSLVNAFAVMGNQIVLTKGLLRAASSPDEVAGVLGHEMGHAIEVHPESAVLRALGTVIGMQVLLGGWTPDLVTEAASQLLLLRHSRSNETEADEVALRLLKSAGIAPGPFAGFFDRIGKEVETEKAKGLTLPDVFSTHPPPPERAKRAKSQPAYPATPALESADWEALRNICG